MLPRIPHNLQELPIYKKAMEICTLSQNISCCLGYDLSELNSDGTEDNNIYFSGDIVQQSVSLAPEIINAELNRGSDSQHRHTQTLNRLISLLYKNSYRLEKSKSVSKDYLPLLRKELKKFRQLQMSWMMTL